MKFKLLISPQKIALYSIDLSLSVGGDLQIHLVKPNNRVFWFYEFSVEIFFLHNSKEYLHAIIW